MLVLLLFIIALAVFEQITSVTNRRTDRSTDIQSGAVLRGAGGPRPPNEKCGPPSSPPILAQPP